MRALLITFTRLLTLTLFAMLIFTSCSKDERDYKLTIHVTVEDNISVQNSLVRVYAPIANTLVDYWGTTDENGELTFEFENEVVVEIIASKSSFKNCGFIALDRGDNFIQIDLKAFGEENRCKDGQ